MSGRNERRKQRMTENVLISRKIYNIFLNELVAKKKTIFVRKSLKFKN